MARIRSIYPGTRDVREHPISGDRFYQGASFIAANDNVAHPI